MGGTAVLGCCCTNESSQARLLRILLEMRADVNHQAAPRTVSARRTVHNAQDIIRGGNLTNQDTYSIDKDLATYEGCTALMWAVQRGKVADVKELLRARADL